MDEEDGLIDLEEFSFSMNLKDHSLMSISLFKALDTNKVNFSSFYCFDISLQNKIKNK